MIPGAGFEHRMSDASTLDTRPSSSGLLAFYTGMAKDNSKFHKIKQDALAIWDERFHVDKELSRLHRFLHFWVLVVKSFNRNRCPTRASALSFTTLLALIPMLAVAISITSSLLKKQGEEEIYRVVDKVISRIIPQVPTTNAPPTAGSSPTNTSEGGSALTKSEASSPDEGTNVVQRAAGGTNISSGEFEANREAAIAEASAETNPPAVGDGRRTATQKEAVRRIQEFVQKTTKRHAGCDRRDFARAGRHSYVGEHRIHL